MSAREDLLAADPAELSLLLELPAHVVVTERLGATASSAVWRGRDRRRGADVVVKAVAPERRGSMETEARAMARAGDHPGVLTVATVGTGPGGHAWTVTDEMRGSIAELAAGEDVTQLLRWGAQSAEALAHVHAAGIVHGDITPTNVLIDPAGHARLADFGAAVMQRDVPDARPGGHTPAWSAPDRRRGAPATPESDVYGLSATLLHVLPGAGEGVRRRVRRLLARGVQRDPARRPTAHDLARGLAP